MCSRTRTFGYTTDCSAEIERLKAALKSSEAVLIGAGAGLSAAAGYEYAGKRFRDNFADFEEKYGFHDMYEGGFYPFETEEEEWAFWSRSVMLNRYTPPPEPLYEKLLSLVGGEYFVLTTNVDHCFRRVGFDKKRLFYTQGDYGLFQCSEPCCRETFGNEAAIREMCRRQSGMRIPTELLPRCPRCGKPLTLNLRRDDSFVEDAGWHAAAERFAEFLRANRSGRVLYLELGVGYNTPSIIKFPFQALTAENPEAVYACVNLGGAECPENIAERSILINRDISEVLNKC